MSVLQEIVAKIRRELGDFGQPFVDTFVGDGLTSEYDMTETQISAYTLTKTEGGATVTLVDGTDYTIDKVNGILYLQGSVAPLAAGAVVIVNGTTYGMFSDDELSEYANDAFLQHAAARTVSERFRDQSGFIRYATREMTIEDLPEVEVFLVALLATIESLWALTTDASTDVDIETADGTTVHRSTRYAQMRNQIDVLTDKYHDLCAQLNVGLHRIEVMHLRRVSRTTGRLVPLFESREYDDINIPTRLLPPIDGRYADDSGVASPIYTAGFLP